MPPGTTRNWTTGGAAASWSIARELPANHGLLGRQGGRPRVRGAQQLEQWPEDQPDIYQAWKNAMKLGLYRKVKNDRGKTVKKAYAAVNQLEYFAELSCMYFVGCDYQPFDRKELQRYDPVGYAMIEKMWALNNGESR